jgi:hypothetical protein
MMASTKTMKPWVERIPQAIEKAEGRFGAMTVVVGAPPHGWITRTEVALAKALWELFYNSPEYNGEYTPVPEVLRAFTEKVEALGE